MRTRVILCGGLTSVLAIFGVLPATSWASEVSPPPKQRQQGALNSLGSGVLHPGPVKTQLAPGKALAYSRSGSYVRGGSLLRTTDSMYMSYTGSAILSSFVSQRCESILPNRCYKRGVSYYVKNSTVHGIHSNYTVAEGLPTPWGPVEVLSRDIQNEWHLYGTGRYWVGIIR